MKISLYGKVLLMKQYCKDCKGEYIVIDNKLQCCNAIVKVNEVTKVRRECESIGSKISSQIKDKVLAIQEYKCYLCGINLKIRHFYKKRNRWIVLRVEFDHFIPKAFVDIGSIDNIYAMCSLCNGMKGSKIFDDVEQARKYIRNLREKNGTLEVYTEMEILTRS